VKTIKLSSASRSLAEYAKELDEQIVLVTERNKPVAAVVPLKNVDRETLAFENHREVTPAVYRRQDVVAGRDEKSGSTLPSV